MLQHMRTPNSIIFGSKIVFIEICDNDIANCPISILRRMKINRITIIYCSDMFIMIF